jgi:hypothetical protein
VVTEARRSGGLGAAVEDNMAPQVSNKCLFLAHPEPSAAGAASGVN